MSNSAIIDLFVEQIQNNQTIALPVNGIFYLAARVSPDNQKKLQELTRQKTKYPQALFGNKDQVLAYTSEIPTYARFFVRSIWPNPIALVLNIRQFFLTQENKVICYLHEHPQVQTLLDKLGEPILIMPAVLGNLPPAVDKLMLEKYYQNQVLVFLPENYTLFKVAPTLLDCSQEDQAELLQPGPVAFTDIRKVLPKSVNLIKAWQKDLSQNLSLKDKNLLKENTYKVPQLDQLLSSTEDYSEPVVLIGTKETFNKVIGTKNSNKSSRQITSNSPIFWQLLELYHNKIFLNLGSQTNLEGIARNLYFNLFKAKQMARHTILLEYPWQNEKVDQNNKWKQILAYNLAKYF